MLPSAAMGASGVRGGRVVRSPFALAVAFGFALVACGGPASTTSEGPDGATPDATTSSDGSAPDGSTGLTNDGATGVGLDSGGRVGTRDGSAPSETGSADAEGPSDAPPSIEASVACGTRTGMRGLTDRSITAAGLNRTYWVYLPSTFPAATPMPFVYVFHGYTMSGQDMVNMTDYQALADSEGIAIAFPDGQGGPNSISRRGTSRTPGKRSAASGSSPTRRATTSPSWTR